MLPDLGGAGRWLFAKAKLIFWICDHLKMSDSQLMAHFTATGVPDFIIPSFTMMEA